MSAVVEGTVLPDVGCGCFVQRVKVVVPSGCGADEGGAVTERRALMLDIGLTAGAMIAMVRTVRIHME
jgi:hypothetical protein